MIHLLYYCANKWFCIVIAQTLNSFPLVFVNTEITGFWETYQNKRIIVKSSFLEMLSK